MHDYQPIVIPAATTVVAAQQMASGPPIPPIARIRLYSAEEWEAFTNEWAHSFFQGKDVVRFSGAGDKGIDIAVFDPGQTFHGIWDGYQCKHYDNPLRPSDIYVELGKVLWFSFNDDYKAPRSYTFIAPRGIGTKLNSLLKSPDKLRQELITNWEKHCRKEITSTQEILLEGEFLAYVNGFDFKIFQGKQPLALIDEHRASPYHLSRFGGGFPARPMAACPPADIGAHETKYVEQLYLAYADHLKKPVRRVVAVTKAAQDMAITANPLAPIAQTQDRRGICHQLANDDKLKWTR